MHCRVWFTPSLAVWLLTFVPASAGAGAPSGGHLPTLTQDGCSRTEFPAAFSAWAGVGGGSGHGDDAVGSGFFGLAGIEAAWRFAPGRALVATYEGAGDVSQGMFSLSGRPHLSDLEYSAITLGPQFSVPPGRGVALFCRGSAGVGLTTNGHRESGFALSGAGGLRLVFPPGPVGFVFAVHAARTFARNSSCGAVGLTLGLTIYPLGRQTAATIGSPDATPTSLHPRIAPRV